MGVVSDMRCVRCGRSVPAPVSAGVCPHCNDPFAVLQVEFDLERAATTLTAESLKSRPMNHWRYHELLPIEPDPEVFGWPIGMTPLIEVPRLAAWAGLGSLRLKDDTRNPTASFKDRASSVGVAHAMQAGATHIACASTGNAASSLAGFAAMAGMRAMIFVPRSAPAPKVTQLLMYGADVRRVQGTYAQAYDLCAHECEANGWYNRNCATNPYVIEGKKTGGLEIAEQTAEHPADWVVVSVGDGCTIAGIANGLKQMHTLGFLERVPRMLGVQASCVHPIMSAFEKGAFDERAESGPTMADSIDVPVPRNWRKAVAAVRESDGAFVAVNDDEIAGAMRACAALGGVFGEPAAAASVAGAKLAAERGIIGPGETVVAVITGSGLKDIAGARRIAGEPTDVPPVQ